MTDPARKACIHAMRASLCTKHSSSAVFKTRLDTVILFCFSTSDLPSHLLAYYRFHSLSLPQIPLLAHLSSPLSSPPAPLSPNTDLRLRWTLSQVKFAPAPLGEAPFRRISFTPSKTSPVWGRTKTSGLLLIVPWSWTWTRSALPSGRPAALHHFNCLSLSPCIPRWMGHCSVETARLD